MTSDPRQQDQRRRFDELYERSLASVMVAVERKVCGCDYGGSSWTTRAVAEHIADLLKLEETILNCVVYKDYIMHAIIIGIRLNVNCSNIMKSLEGTVGNYNITTRRYADAVAGTRSIITTYTISFECTPKDDYILRMT